MTGVEQLVAQLDSITDPVERARTAHHALDRYADELRNVRDMAINEMRYGRKLSLREIADLLSASGSTISKSRIADITA